MSKRAIIVGGGISGVTAGFRLQQAGCEVLLVEAENRFGGRMRSELVDGFVVDTGAGILPGSFAAMHQLMQDAGLLGILDELKAPIAVMRNRKLHYIDGDNPVVAIARSGLLGTKSMLKLGKLPFKLAPMWSSLDFENLGKAHRFDTETVADYCRRALTDEALDYLIGPLVKAMYATSPSRSSVIDFLWCLKNLLTAQTYSIRGGMEALPTAIAGQLQETRLQTSCTEVKETKSGVEVRLKAADGREYVEHADVCVLAVPARDMPALHPGLSGAVRAQFKKLCYTATAEIHLMIREPTDERSAVILVPDSEDSDMTAISFVHNRGRCRVPDGKGAVSVYFHERWAAGMRGCSDEQVYEVGMRKLKRLMPTIEPLVVGHLVKRWDIVATMSHPGYWKDVQQLHQSMDFKSRIQLAGDFFSLACVNTAVVSGERVARQLKESRYLV